MLESRVLEGSKVQTVPVSSAHQKALLEEAVRKDLPTLTMVYPIEFWEFGDWVYVFVTTKVLWKKLRIYGLQRLYRYKDEKTGLEIVEDPGLDVTKLSLMLTKEKEDLVKVEDTFREGVQSGVFNNLEVTLPAVHKINPMLYEQRMKHYDEFRRIVCGLLGTNSVLTHKLIIRAHLKIYQLKVTATICEKSFDIRILENNQRFKFEIRPSADSKFGSMFESFPLPDDYAGLMKKLKALKVNATAYETMKNHMVEKYGLVEAKANKPEEGFVDMGAWDNKLGSIHIEIFSDDTIQNVWILTHYNFRKSFIQGQSVNLTELKLLKTYNPDMFAHDMSQFLDRTRLLDESDALDPMSLLNKIESFKNSVHFNPTLNWDCKDNRWEIFSMYLLDFPIPISLTVGYDFVTDRLDIKSLPLQGEYKTMNLLAEATYKCLEQLRTNWQQLPKPDQITQCARYQFPKLTSQAILDQVLPQFLLYDVIFANRNDYYQAGLNLGNGNVLHMEPSGNYKQLEPAEHLRVSKLVDFICHTEFIVFREKEELTERQLKDVELRLAEFPKKFVYYGFALNPDEVILNIRWGITGSLETAFLFVMFRYLMEKNLMEKELMEYIHGLVAARTEEGRLQFLKQNKHSIVKAAQRLRVSCSPQMLTLLNRFDWLFEAQAY